MLRSILARWPLRLPVRTAVFAVVFFSVVATLNALAASNIFWLALGERFRLDERYQAQSLFLPDRRRDIPTVIIGDAAFQAVVSDPIDPKSYRERVILNGYDADDLSNTMKIILKGEKLTRTRVCTLIVQISPIFRVRSKALYLDQETELVENYASSSILSPEGTGAFFSTIKAWAATHDSGPLLEQPHRRPGRLVGQTRFSDPTLENWNSITSRLKKFEGDVVGVLDPRFTDFGAGSDLIEATVMELNAFASAHESFSWIELDDLAAFRARNCSR